MARPKPLVIPGQDVEITNRRLKVWEGILEHKSVATLAKELGVRPNTIYKDKSAVLKEAHDTTGENAEMFRNELMLPLQKLLERWMPLATAEDLVVQGEKINSKGERTIIELEAFESGATASKIALETIREIAKLQGAYKTDDGTTPNGARIGRPLKSNFLVSIQKLASQQEEPVQQHSAVLEAELIEDVATNALHE